MAALALQPHRQQGGLQRRFGYLDFVLLLTWWTFLYAFVVFPWMYATPSESQYNYNYDVVTHIQNMVIVARLGLPLAAVSKGAWRLVYANLFGGATLYMLSSLTINVAITLNKYHTGSLYDLPLISSFLWFAFAGLIAYRNRAALDAPSEEEDGGRRREAAGRAHSGVTSGNGSGHLSARFCDLHAALCQRGARGSRLSADDHAHRFGAAGADRILPHTHRRQGSRALAGEIGTIGREPATAAGADSSRRKNWFRSGNSQPGRRTKSTIRSPPFWDIPIFWPTIQLLPRNHAPSRPRFAIRPAEQKHWSAILLSFARQVPAERTFWTSTPWSPTPCNFRSLDLRSAKTRIELQLESVLPGVRGDGNQLMQVFFNIINNAVDAMESHDGGVLTIKTIRDRGNVIVLFSDTGPASRSRTAFSIPSTRPSQSVRARVWV